MFVYVNYAFVKGRKKMTKKLSAIVVAFRKWKQFSHCEKMGHAFLYSVSSFI